ncbi:hypothetical protein K502DRAFT_21679 [Neoconidiobolus thromboides FSU 785]|nr:hypothetical protein K502DRAFT_21679 [Neoconidiobolus thromboides FSU 785]
MEDIDYKPKNPGGDLKLENREDIEKMIIDCSQFYENIYLNQLSGMVDLPMDLLIQLLMELITRGKLLAHIDQVDMLLIFEDDDNEEEEEEVKVINEEEEEAENESEEAAMGDTEENKKEEEEEEKAHIQSEENLPLKLSNQFNAQILDLCKNLDAAYETILELEAEALEKNLNTIED